jgi:hypothetical protein
MASGKLKILMDHDLDHEASPDRSAVLGNCRVETCKKQFGEFRTWGGLKLHEFKHGGFAFISPTRTYLFLM